MSKEENQTFHPSFLRVLELFISRYGEEEGGSKFSYFLVRNGLDPSLSYDPHVQFNESFTWAEPYIRFMKQDKQAKYYAVRALHAIVSLNNNDYTDQVDMEVAAPTMNYRPLNYNHDHDRWIPYPRTRVEYAKAEDMCVELILRVDNQDAYLQKQLDHDISIPEKEWINHPSIEGRPMLGGAEKGYHFTALAMLEKGYHIPGDPLSEIFPIMMEGVQGGEVCLMVNGEKVCLECDTALSEGNTMSENYKIGEINHGGAICPNCDHVVNLDGIKIPSEVDCPNCGTAMEARPEKTVETANKLNNIEGDTTNMSNPEENPPVIENQEEEESLKTHYEALLAKQKEESSSKSLKGVRELEVLKNTLRIRDDTVINLNERISELEKIASTHTGIQAELFEITESKAVQKKELDEYKEKLASSQGESSAKEIEIKSLKTQTERLGKQVESSNSETAKWKRMHDNRSVEISEALERATLNSQKAINAIREKSEIQTDNADLREQIAKSTKEYSALAQKRHEDATKILQLEKTISSLEESTRKADDAHKDKLAEAVQTIEKAKKFHSWAWKQLKEAGVAVLQNE